MRREPEYDPDALRENIKTIDRSIDRIQGAIAKLQQENKLIKQKIARNNEDIRIFHTEIGKLEHQKDELRRLIDKIEKRRG